MHSTQSNIIFNKKERILWRSLKFLTISSEFNVTFNSKLTGLEQDSSKVASKVVESQMSSTPQLTVLISNKNISNNSLNYEKSELIIE
jgi:hypothetical protein